MLDFIHYFSLGLIVGSTQFGMISFLLRSNSLVEDKPHKLKVVGSIPTSATNTRVDIRV